MDYLSETISTSLALMAYNEDKIGDYARELFGLKPHFIKLPGGKLFWGICIDEKNHTFYLVIRGTDGDTPISNMESWANNFRLLCGLDGVHNGFQMDGNIIFDSLKEYFPKYSHGYISGQSKGGSILPYVQRLVAENTNCNTHGDAFAAFPCFNEVGARVYNKHVMEGRCTLNSWRIKRDPANLAFLRNQDSAIFNGVDVGEQVWLPTINDHKIGSFDTNPFNHSCRVICVTKAVYCMNENDKERKLAVKQHRDPVILYPQRDINLLINEVFPRCVN